MPFAAGEQAALERGAELDAVYAIIIGAAVCVRVCERLRYRDEARSTIGSLRRAHCWFLLSDSGPDGCTSKRSRIPGARKTKESRIAGHHLDKRIAFD